MQGVEGAIVGPGGREYQIGLGSPSELASERVD